MENVFLIFSHFYPFHSLSSPRLVNELLADELKLIHAFEQRTLTPEQWAKEQEDK